MKDTREPTSNEVASEVLLTALWILIPLTPFVIGAGFFEDAGWGGVGSVFSWMWDLFLSVWSPFGDVIFNILIDIVLVVAGVVVLLILVVYLLGVLLVWSIYHVGVFAVQLLVLLAGVSTGGTVVAVVVGAILFAVFVVGPLWLLVVFAKGMVKERIKRQPSPTAALAAQGRIIDSVVEAVTRRPRWWRWRRKEKVVVMTDRPTDQEKQLVVQVSKLRSLIPGIPALPLNPDEWPSWRKMATTRARLRRGTRTAATALECLNMVNQYMEATLRYKELERRLEKVQKTHATANTKDDLEAEQIETARAKLRLERKQFEQQIAALEQPQPTRPKETAPERARRRIKEGVRTRAELRLLEKELLEGKTDPEEIEEIKTEIEGERLRIMEGRGS